MSTRPQAPAPATPDSTATAGASGPARQVSGAGLYFVALEAPSGRAVTRLVRLR